MYRCLRTCSLVVIGLGMCWSLAAADAPPAKNGADLSEFKTVENAITTRVSRSVTPTATKQPAYLGVHFEGDKGQLIVSQVESGSPAAKADLQKGDAIREIAGQSVNDLDGLRGQLRGREPGEVLAIKATRDGKPLVLSATLKAISKPMTGPGQRAVLGVQTSEAKDGVKIDQVTASSAAATAGLKVGDIIVKIDGAPAGPDKLGQTIGDKKPGDVIALLVKREDKEIELKAKLGGEPANERERANWDTRSGNTWKKDVYRLAVIPIDYPDVKHNSKITGKDWEKALFSKGAYTGKSVTGQTVHGSLNDYYQEISCGALRVEGKVFDPVEVGKKRQEYSSGANRTALLTEVLDKLLEKDKDALKNFDGIFFLYSGNRVQTQRGGLYWPHRASFNHKGKRWGYFICPEGGEQMASISVISHEFGHMLGLPDLYAKPENPGSEGLGVWCTMSNGHGRDGKPLHFSAWCKEQMGWIKPCVIDPTVKQKLILAPIENSTKECYKVLLKKDGSEYLLLENRTKKGYDRDLPAEGLLIWRVLDGKPVLEESHGVAGPDGPRRFLGAVPYPSPANNAFTPLTTPSSKSLNGGISPLHITNIQRLPDGRISFHIGYEYF